MLHIINHPLVSHWVTELRDVETSSSQFRWLLRMLSMVLFMEATRDLPLMDHPVQTPLAEFRGQRAASLPVLVPILRAGLGMADGILQVAPRARTCHLGIYRDHQTLQPVFYYYNQGVDLAGEPAFVLDPMLATGGSACAALERVRDWGADPVKLLCVIGAPEGVQHVEAAHPQVEIYLCALDERLNDLGYIVPGLGDAGDRQFG